MGWQYKQTTPSQEKERRKTSKKKKDGDLFLKKSWYNLLAPTFFQSKVVGKTVIQNLHEERDREEAGRQNLRGLPEGSERRRPLQEVQVHGDGRDGHRVPLRVPGNGNHRRRKDRNGQEVALPDKRNLRLHHTGRIHHEAPDGRNHQKGE